MTRSKSSSSSQPIGILHSSRSEREFVGSARSGLGAEAGFAPLEDLCEIDIERSNGLFSQSKYCGLRASVVGGPYVSLGLEKGHPSLNRRNGGSRGHGQSGNVGGGWPCVKVQKNVPGGFSE